MSADSNSDSDDYDDINAFDVKFSLNNSKDSATNHTLKNTINLLCIVSVFCFVYSLWSFYNFIESVPVIDEETGT